MNIDALQRAILDKDPDGVVAALAEWDESQRAAVTKPFNVLMLALGFDDVVMEPCDIKADDSQVQELRRREGIQPKRRGPGFDYEMQ